MYEDETYFFVLWNVLLNVVGTRFIASAAQFIARANSDVVGTRFIIYEE